MQSVSENHQKRNRGPQHVAAGPVRRTSALPGHFFQEHSRVNRHRPGVAHEVNLLAGTAEKRVRERGVHGDQPSHAHFLQLRRIKDDHLRTVGLVLDVRDRIRETRHTIDLRPTSEPRLLSDGRRSKILLREVRHHTGPETLIELGRRDHGDPTTEKNGHDVFDQEEVVQPPRHVDDVVVRARTGRAVVRHELLRGSQHGLREKGHVFLPTGEVHLGEELRDSPHFFRGRIPRRFFRIPDREKDRLAAGLGHEHRGLDHPRDDSGVLSLPLHGEDQREPVVDEDHVDVVDVVRTVHFGDEVWIRENLFRIERETVLVKEKREHRDSEGTLTRDSQRTRLR